MDWIIPENAFPALTQIVMSVTLITKDANCAKIIMLSMNLSNALLVKRTAKLVICQTIDDVRYVRKAIITPMKLVLNVFLGVPDV